MTEESDTGFPYDAAQVVAAFGGIRPTAARLGVPATTVQGWKKRGAIPQARRADVLRAAREAGIDLAAAPPVPEQLPRERPEAAGETSSGSPQFVHVHHLARESRDEDEDESEAASRARAFEKARDRPAFFDESVPADIAKKIERIERKSGRVAILAGAAFVGIAVCLVLILLWPSPRGVEEYDDRLTAVEGTVMHLGQTAEEKTPDTGWLAEIDRQMQDLRKQAVDMKASVEGAVEKARGSLGEIVGPDAGPLSERIAKLEEKVQEISGPSALVGVLARAEEYAKTVEGQGSLDALVSRLRALTAGAGGDAAAVDSSLETAAKTDPQIGAAFEGVEPGDFKAAAMLVAFTRLREALNRGNTPFEDDLQLLLNLAGDENPELKESLLRLAPHAKSGVLTPSGLSGELRGLAGDIVAASLSGEEVSFEERARARLNEVLRIEKKGELVTGTDTQARIARAEALLEKGEVQAAVGELQGLEGQAAETAQPLLGQAEAVMMAEKVKALISQLTQTRLSTGGSAKYTTGFKGLSDLVPTAPVIRDEESGVVVMPAPGAPPIAP